MNRTFNQHNRPLANGFVAVEVAFVSVVLLVIIFGVFFVTQIIGSKATPTQEASSSTSSTAPATQSANYAVLSPATVPSKTPECAQAISFAANGDSGPVQCSNGDLNATEWQALAAIEPSVMSLGYDASAAQIQSALCSDVNASKSDANTKNSAIVEATVYQISALYYGWNFSPSPATILSSGGC